MTRRLALFLACCLPLSAPAQTVPVADAASKALAAETDPARQALDAWLAAFNANDREQLEAFRDRYQPTMDVEGMLDFHQRTGGFQLIRHEPSDPGSAQALLREMDSDTIARMQVTAKGDAPLTLGIEMIEPPADLRIPRLDRTAAIDALTAKADSAAKQDGFSGVLLVAHGDDVLLQRAWGVADRKAGARVTLDTKFRLGSMNKMFTAVATLQLAQAGKLSLDGSVGQYLPDYPNAEIAKVTIRQLLTHSGGTGDIFGPQFDAQRLSLRTHDDYVRLYGARGPEHPPGEAHRYSNYGFLLLGAIIERAGGRSYYDYVDAHIFAPAGMADSGSLPEDVAVPGRARAYTREDRSAPWTDAADTLPYRGTAAGGGYSTAGDLLKFARALQNGTLLPPALLADATQRQSPWYGHGFVVAEEQGVPWYGHGGGAQGMNGELRIFPTLGVVVIGLGSVDPPAVSRLVDYYQVRMPLADAREDVCSASAFPEADVVARVPFELVNGRVYVQARVNGQGPFRFAVDTGASGMGRADSTLVSALDLRTHGTSSTSDGVQTADVETTRLDSLELGGLSRRDLQVIARDYGSRSSPRAAFDGIIARDFFADGLLVIDYPARTLSFTRARSLSPGDKNVLAYTRAFRVPVLIGDMQVEGNLDTGANIHFVVPKSLYDKLAASPLEEAGRGTLANSEIETQRAIVHGPFRIGGTTLSDVDVRVSDSFPELLVGAHALQNSVLMIDQRSRSIAVCAR